MDGEWKNTLKKIFRKIFVLPPVPTLLVALPSYLFVIYVLSGGAVHQSVAYIAYLLSAYAFIIMICFTYRFFVKANAADHDTIPGAKGIAERLREGFYGNPLVKRLLDIPLVKKYMGDVFFRTESLVCQGLFINLLYAGIKLFWPFAISCG